MKTTSTLLAAFALIATGCAKAPQNETVTTSTEPAAEAVEMTPVVFTEPATIEFSVPEMSCPHGCYPGVKDALSKQPGVVAIQLGTPAEETTDEINDRRVIVTTDGKFDATAAVAAFPSHLQVGVTVEEVEGSESTDAAPEQPAEGA